MTPLPNFARNSSGSTSSILQAATSTVSFDPHADSAHVGGITCIAVQSGSGSGSIDGAYLGLDGGSGGSGSGSVLVTGHEKGSIVVWHGLEQYYLDCLGRMAGQKLLRSEGDSTSTSTVSAVGKSGKHDKKKHSKHHTQQQPEEDEEHNGKPDSNETGDHAAPAVRTTMHWHATAVHCLSLSEDSSTLYSGGAEGVLVLWHNIATSSSTGASKSFIPRLGCPISFVANNSR
jgi:hypothetical protein